MQHQQAFNGAPNPKRARLIGLLLGAVIIGLFVAGAIGFRHSSGWFETDPGLSYRTPETLDKLLARAEQAEKAGDRAAAIVTYRFVVAVGAGADPEIARYIAAARRSLARLGVPEVAPGGTAPSAPAPPPVRGGAR